MNATLISVVLEIRPSHPAVAGEDNPADVRLLQYGLEETGARCSLQIAIDGEQALDLLQPIRTSGESRPDLIFLDLNLPKCSGHEVLAVMKADAQLCLIPVIVLSSSRAPADILSAYRQGANSYLQRPSNLDEHSGFAADDRTLLAGPGLSARYGLGFHGTWRWSRPQKVVAGEGRSCL